MVILAKVSAVLLLQSVLVYADRDVRKGRNAALDVHGVDEFGHRRTISSPSSTASLLAVEGDDIYVPNFDAITKARDSVNQHLGTLSENIIDANKQAVNTLNQAVTWKQASSKIPILAHEVNTLTASDIFNPIKGIAPKLSKFERQAMSTLLKAVIADLNTQRTLPEPQEDIPIPDPGGNDIGGESREAPERLIPPGGY
mmetsp:Transcript_10647/g.23257  ORF Transcript_10647/g.23257 Transcript_10647/m.23257 type:complete len:199 (-) Transcript_10647:109-705(-)|eukprot:CAMPEP_0206584716 /NCGR_PEP_ID=MMETSP0325_2-20121206/35923_1 /ASSEMBLY_ACC=CAM_ASM_000347 /TAXON_ID=2866 /ORGANISM="Crypthecodinium cohnii, Strain Seligo" /LENGTH=198 /DNA_ID=CAMNT_0054091997 /DNA_START=56 /DNA_END=652 /DNA_ORIENTATION=+